MDFSFLKTDIKSCLRVWIKNIKWIFISLLLHRLSHLHLSVSRNTTSKLVLNIKHLWYFYQIFIGLNIHFEYKINSWSIFGNFIERDTCYLIYSCTDKSFIYSNTPRVSHNIGSTLFFASTLPKNTKVGCKKAWNLDANAKVIRAGRVG